MKTTIAILLANTAVLALLTAFATRGTLPLSHRHGNAVPPTVIAKDVAAKNRTTEPAIASAYQWEAPLLDRTLSSEEKSERLAPDLMEAIGRIEPVFDPTRLDGPLDPPLHVSAGSASTYDIFGERWRLASADPNVNLRVRTLALAFLDPHDHPCRAFRKERAHDFGEPALDALTRGDCLAIAQRTGNDAEPVALAAAPLDLPIFAAPMPGSRMNSQDFWAAQKARIAAIQAHLHRRWDDRQARMVRVGSNR